MRVRSYFRYKKSDPARVVIQLLTFLRCQRAFSLETRLAVACRQTTCLFLRGLLRVSLGQKSGISPGKDWSAGVHLTCGVVLVVLVLLRQLQRLLLHQITGGAMYLWIRGQFFPHRLHIAVARSRQLCLLVG